MGLTLIISLTTFDPLVHVTQSSLNPKLHAPPVTSRNTLTRLPNQDRLLALSLPSVQSVFLSLLFETN